jgi:MGT family glycosyltransferase
VARFLFAVWPFAGHVHPAIAVAHALRERGHEVAFYTGAAVRDLAEGEGFKFFPFQKVDEARTSVLASSEFPYTASAWRRLRAAKRLQGKFREWLLDTVPQQVDDIDAVLTEWRPDVLVCDLAFWSPILVFHEARRIPVAVLSILASCILPGPDAPPWGQGLVRPRNAIMRLRSRLHQTLLRGLSVGFRSDVNAMRRRYGLPPLSCSVTEFAGQMPLYIVPSTPEYDYERRDLPPSVSYVGPCLWDKPSHTRPPEWIAQIPEGRPVVYVTEATIGTTEPFLIKAAARGLRDLPAQVVMTTGRQRNPAELDLGASAPNVRVEAYVPQSELLPRTAVMVTLGGSGGVLAALRAGVPLVVVPTEWDRPENAQRVVESGAGLRIAPNRCTPERLRAAVERVLNEPSFRKNASRLASAFARYEGPARAARLLEGLYFNSTRNPKLRRGVTAVYGGSC